MILSVLVKSEVLTKSKSTDFIMMEDTAIKLTPCDFNFTKSGGLVYNTVEGHLTKK